MSREPNNTDGLFTAGEIARAAGLSVQHVRQVLKAVRPDSAAFRSGQQCRAWRFGRLPETLVQRLFTVAARQGHSGPIDLLANSTGRWRPPVSTKEVHPKHLDKAGKLLRALRPSLNRWGDRRISARERERLGLDEYQRVFGHTITPRHWLKLMKRTIERDRGFEDWDRIEIYLDDRLGRAPKCEAGFAPEIEEAFGDLPAMISSFEDKTRPTRIQNSLVWSCAFQVFDECLEYGEEPQKLKDALIALMFSQLPGMAKSAAALRRNWRRKYKAWKESGEDYNAVRDKRSDKSGWHRTPELPEQDRLVFLRCIMNCGGRVSQGVREAFRSGQISAQTFAHYCGGSSKYYVARSLREALKYDAAILGDHAHGPHRAKIRGPYIHRKHDHASGDWLQADDLTCPIYCYDEDHLRNPCRPQVLVTLDTRSIFIQGFITIMSKAYNGSDVRSLMTLSHDTYGLPREGYYFENSVWKSKLVREVGWQEVEWEGVQNKLGMFGIKFRHAREARAKVIEGVLGLMQNQMERDMGYAGRDERHDKYERLAKHLRLVRAGKVHPGEFLMHRDELHERLHEICQTYNNERQEGKILQGRSPAEGYQEFFTTPLLKLAPASRYMLASYRRPVTVTGDGITLRFHGRTYNYKNETTGRLRGQKLIAWFNPQEPDILSVTDLQEEIPFTVERCEDTSAMSATAEELEAAHSQIKAHSTYGRRLYRTVNQAFPADFAKGMCRSITPDPEAAELGRNMERQRRDTAAKREARKGKEAGVAAVARDLGLPAESERARNAARALPELAKFLAGKDGDT